MDLQEIENILQEALSLSFVKVTGDGSHFQVIAVGDCFDGATRIKRQKMIYAPLQERISSGEMHALTIKTYTEEQWQKDKALVLPG
jgi:acid stress-induced BolA-like protein IbaG/YrbA